MYKVSAILVWLCLLGISGTASASEEPAGTLLPPVRDTLPMSSSFGEYRQGHYHGGVDFSTGGQEGVPVIAPRDGWVFRLRASGVGYGKAVYFRLDNGFTVLYAHLSRFHPRLESILENAQDRARRYEIDLRPGPGEIAFSAGEVLGYSGQTGAGVPHLHAEMREGEEAAVAVNPLNHGWSVSDPHPPRLTRILVAPGAAGVLVNGGVEAVSVSLEDPPMPAFRTTGAVRVWVETEDRAAGGAYRLAPYRVRADVDGRKRVELVLDRFHWNWAREVEWTFHSARARREKERWVRMEAPPGGRQDIAAEFDGGLAAVGELEPGNHVLTLEALDISGNRAVASVTFLLESGSRSERLPGPPVTRSRLVSRGSYLEIHLVSAPGEEVSLVARGPKGDRGPRDWTRFGAPGGWVYQWDAPGTGNPELWWFYRVDETGETPIGLAIHTGGEGATDPRKTVIETAAIALDLEPGTTYGPHWITLGVGRGVRTPADAPELEPIGSEEVELGPWALPLRERMSVVWLFGTADPSGLALCKKTAAGWSYLGSDTSGRGVGATLGSLETLALFRDRVPPRIELDPPAEGGIDRIVARIRDGGVGLHWSDLEMILDGDPVVAEWDPESDSLIGHLRSALAPGEHRVMVRAADRVGNTSQRETTFTVP